MIHLQDTLIRRGGLRTPIKGGGQVLWNPAQLGSALVAWWDANQGVAQSAGLVSAWTDRQSGIVMSQATGAKQPNYSTTARNGAAGLVFSGSHILQNANPALLPTGADPSVIAIGAYSGAAGKQAFEYGAQGTRAWRSVQENGNNLQLSLYAADLSTTVVWNGQDRFIEWDIGASAQTIYADGVQTTTSAFVPATSSTGSISIGGADGSASWVGVIQEIVVTNRALTTSERQKLEGWESWIDGKAGANLPSGHPYKSRAPYVSDP